MFIIFYALFDSFIDVIIRSVFKILNDCWIWCQWRGEEVRTRPVKDSFIPYTDTYHNITGNGDRKEFLFPPFWHFLIPPEHHRTPLIGASPPWWLPITRFELRAIPAIPFLEGVEALRFSSLSLGSSHSLPLRRPFLGSCPHCI